MGIWNNLKKWIVTSAIIGASAVFPMKSDGEQLEFRSNASAGISGSITYLFHESGAQEFGPDGYDNPWTNAPPAVNNQQLRAFTNPYGDPLKTDSRPLESDIKFRSNLCAIDKLGGNVTSTNKLKFTFLDSADSIRHYTANIHCDGIYTPLSNSFDKVVNIRDVIANDAGVVNLPGVMNCPSGTVYGVVDIHCDFNKLVSTKLGAGNGTNTVGGNVFTNGQNVITNYDSSATIELNADVGNYIDSCVVTRTDNLGGLSVETNSFPDKTVTSTNVVLSNIMGSNQVEAVYVPRLEQIVSTAGVGGTINPSGTNNVFYNENTNFVITANPNYEILDIKTNGASIGINAGMTSTNYTLSNIINDGTIEALFDPAYTTNGINKNWLRNNGITNTSNEVETQDPDLDGYNNLQEYTCDTDPTNNASYLQPITLEEHSPLSVVVNHTSTGRTYSLLEKTNMIDGFSWNEITNSRGTGSNLVFELVEDNTLVKFYRIGVRKE